MTAAQPEFLGVGCSFSGKSWRPRLAEDRLGLTLAQRLSLPEIVGRALAARGIGPDDAESYLNPTLRELLPDPSHLLDMDTAARRIAAAVTKAENIAIFGDYDVDGATSAALLKRFLKAVGAEATVYIPDRIREGYGPNQAALLALHEAGAKVVITVDCGITAFEPLAAAAAAGLDVIVVDHHVAEPQLPEAHAVVDPNRLDESSPHRQLAAVGVSYLLVIAVNRELRRAGWYGDGSGRQEPDLLAWLDLVALGTVCDMARLTGVNRALVAQGLKVMARRGNPGLAALGDVAGLDARPDAWHLGFLLGPRVNAGGRVGEADLGVRLLTTSDGAEAARLAQLLDGHNATRREIEAQVFEDAMAQAEESDTSGLVFVAGEGWHPGVIGIVASRLVQHFSRPTCVVALDGNMGDGNMGDGGMGKGSGRSVAGVDLGAAIIAARQAGHLVNGGGHVMAAGFTVSRDKLDALRGFLAERIALDLAQSGYMPTLMVDGALSPKAADTALVDVITRLAPFGIGNSEPRFAFPRVRVVKADIVGENHVRCIIAGEDGGRLKAIAFRAAGTALGDGLLHGKGMALHVAGHLRRDDWMGRGGVQLVVDDGAAVP